MWLYRILSWLLRCLLKLELCAMMLFISKWYQKKNCIGKIRMPNYQQPLNLAGGYMGIPSSILPCWNFSWIKSCRRVEKIITCKETRKSCHKRNLDLGSEREEEEEAELYKRPRFYFKRDNDKTGQFKAEQVMEISRNKARSWVEVKLL